MPEPPPSPREDVPHLGATLRMYPKQHEALFWNSPLHRTATKYIDTWSRCLTVAGHFLFLRWQLQLHNFRADVRVWRSVLLIVWNVIQLLWARRSFETYFRWRPYINWSNKLPIFLSACFHAPYTIRGMISLGTQSTIITTCASPPWLRLPRTLELGKLVLVVSINAFVIQDAFNPPLPTPEQILLHSLYTLLLSITNLHPAAHVLSTFAPELRALCSTVNTHLLVASGLLTSIDIAHGTEHFSQQCDQHAVHVLIIFTNIYAGLLLPVFVSYRLEQHMKQLYLHQLLLQHNEVAAAEDLRSQIGLPHLLDAVIPILLVIPAWMLAVTLHQPVAAVAWPV